MAAFVAFPDDVQRPPFHRMYTQGVMVRAKMNPHIASNVALLP